MASSTRNTMGDDSLSDGARKQYRHPPIIEAVIEFQFGPELTQKELGQVRTKFAPVYATAFDNKHVTVNIDQNGTVSSTGLKTAGHRFVSKDGADLAVVLEGSLTTSRLPPYCGWESVVEVVKRNFSLLRATVGYREITLRSRFDQ